MEKGSEVFKSALENMEQGVSTEPQGEKPVNVKTIQKECHDVIQSAKVMLPSKRRLHRALNQLYPIECPDDEVITETEVNPTELAENFSDANVQ